jgi:Domain of unknown function (DUF4148)
MKTTRIAALALIATAAVGFNAYADSGDNYQPETAQKFVSTLSRAEVQTEAVKATRDNIKRGFNAETGEYLISAPAQVTGSALTREAVRAEAIKARGMSLLQDNAG